MNVEAMKATQIGAKIRADRVRRSQHAPMFFWCLSCSPSLANSGTSRAPSTLVFARHNSTATKYQILGVERSASLKEIKQLFKKLTKQYHPDLNPGTDESQKKVNLDKFIEIVAAYETLKDANKRRLYDAQLRGLAGSNGSRSADRSEWHRKYYGEARYYLRSDGSHHTMALGLNSTRHRVRNFGDFDNQSHVSGAHLNHGDRQSVPHFDYATHLLRNLKFEQRLINKNLTPAQREAILSQLRSSGTPVNEEIITKHLMRQAKARLDSHGRVVDGGRAYHSGGGDGGARDPHMYHGPHDSEGSVKMVTVFTVGAGATFLLYQMWGKKKDSER